MFQLEKGVDGLHQSFQRLDTRISSVGQTAAKIGDHLQFNRGTSAMQHYVASRPMFIDVEVMNTDINLVLGDQGLQAGSNNIARGLSTLYKEITDIRSFKRLMLVCIGVAIELQYLRIFAVAYEKTEDLARELQSIGCGDLDAEGRYLHMPSFS
ncbi:hypothetical protein BHM03_00014522 [Ensete ventricosum]|nr:hypothetical protein BHM03_00014522 [Ensete ventricosum]